jgi:hypothetical protein
MKILAILEKNGWKLCIGDPYPLAWIIFAGYIISAVLCYYIGFSLKKINKGNKEKGDIVFWYGLSALLLFLGINKQLDLQTLFVVIGRSIANFQGWYDIRREVQKFFIIGFTSISLFSFVVILIFLKKQVLKNFYIILGIIMIISYILIRASAFNHIDFIPEKLRVIYSIHMKYVLELFGIILVFYGTFKKLKEINKSYH